MTLLIGRNRNTNDSSSMSDGIPLDATTTATVAAANPNRIALHVHNGDSVKGCWVKLQAANVDDDKKGVFLDVKGSFGSSWDMTLDNIYTGEVSAIADSGSAMLYVTEY
jgi:hypothetical protein